MGMPLPKGFPAAFLIALVAHAGCMAAPSAPPAAPHEANPAASIPRGPEIALKFGMASRDATRVMGRPKDVSPMQAGERIEVRHVTTQVVELLMYNDHFVTRKSSIRRTDQISRRAPWPERAGLRTRRPPAPS